MSVVKDVDLEAMPTSIFSMIMMMMMMIDVDVERKQAQAIASLPDSITQLLCLL